MPPQPSSARLDELRARFKAEPNSRHFYPLGEELRKGGQLDEAEQLLRGGLLKHPAYLSAWVSLGRVLKDQKRYPEAIEALNKAFTIDSGNVVTARLLADTYLATGDKVEAIKKYKLVHALLPADDELQATIDQLDRELNPDAFPVEAAAVAQPAEAEAATEEAPIETAVAPPADDSFEAATSFFNSEGTIEEAPLTGAAEEAEEESATAQEEASVFGSEETESLTASETIDAPLEETPSLASEAASTAATFAEESRAPIGFTTEFTPPAEATPEPSEPVSDPFSMEEEPLPVAEEPVSSFGSSSVEENDVFSQTMPRSQPVTSSDPTDDDLFADDVAAEEPVAPPVAMASSSFAAETDFAQRRQTIARLQTWLAKVKGEKNSV
jgi:tetratricopeptide (TPR) repeat protein